MIPHFMNIGIMMRKSSMENGKPISNQVESNMRIHQMVPQIHQDKNEKTPSLWLGVLLLWERMQHLSKPLSYLVLSNPK
jgi:hypothetical protein